MATKKGVVTVYGTGQLFGNGGTVSNTVNNAGGGFNSILNTVANAITPKELPSTGGTPISPEVANAVLQESVSTAPALPQTTQPSTTTPTVSTWTRPTTNPYDNMYADLEKKITENYGNQITSSTQRKDDTLKRIEADDAAWRKGQTDLYDSYKKRLADDQARDTASANTNYDNSARQNYIAYRQAQKNLPSQLNALGIRGGAAESSLIRLGSNYGTNVANNEMARAQALEAVSRQYTTLIADADAEYRKALLARDDAKAQQIASIIEGWQREQAEINTAMGDALMKAYAQNEENKIAWEAEQDAIAREQADKELANLWKTMEWNRDEEWRNKDLETAAEETAYNRNWTEKTYEDAQKQKMVEQFAAGLAEYTSYSDISKLEKKIDAIKKKNPKWQSDAFDYGRIQAIKARIGELEQLKPKSAGSKSYSRGGSGSYSGGGSSGGSSGGSGGSSNSGSTINDVLTDIAAKAITKAKGSKGSSGHGNNNNRNTLLYM